tara:strand:- start:24482 stop:24964 length:483 start_codon:yes stop_codon:yes gene_type:complete
MLLNKNIIFYFLLFFLSVGYFVVAINLGAPFANNGLQPSSFPLLIGLFAMMFSSILLCREVKLMKSMDSSLEDDTQINSPLTVKDRFAPFAIMLSIFLYILLFSPLGYFLSSILFVFSIIIIFSSLEKALQKIVISTIIVAFGYLVFEQMFGVRLPALWG